MWKLLPTTVALVHATTVITLAQRAADPTVASGGELFVTYCASCHGVTGRGNGPAADELRRPPADLTQFTKHNGGVFNGAKVHSIVDGRAVRAHGSMEMPVWGDAFKWREGLPEQAIKGRIEALVRYLESIQERASH
jgi:mono/diheme cytochrome c family protein